MLAGSSLFPVLLYFYLVTLWIFAKYESVFCTLRVLLDYSVSAFIILLVNKANEWLYFSVFNFQN